MVFLEERGLRRGCCCASAKQRLPRRPGAGAWMPYLARAFGAWSVTLSAALRRRYGRRVPQSGLCSPQGILPVVLLLPPVPAAPPPWRSCPLRVLSPRGAGAWPPSPDGCR